MEFLDEYFRDSVIGGFYVSSMMKRCWAAQLEIFEDVVKICKKYDIKYFADAGTLIGAIRHGGFIPWDDDMDIVMMREDYEEFLAHADELPDNYQVKNWRTDDTWEDAYSRVINTVAPDMSEAFMEKYHGFPFSAGIDIFVNDYLYRDEKLEKEREMLWQNAVDLAYLVLKNALSKKEKEASIKKLEAQTGYRCDKKKGEVRGLHDIAEKLFMEVKKEDADEAAFMPIYIKYGGNKYDKKWYDDAVPMDFEVTKIMVPLWYDKILKEKYGNYLVAQRKGGLHGYPYYSDDIKTLSKLTGWKPPIYECSENEPYIAGEHRAAVSSQSEALRTQLAQIETMMNMPRGEELFASLIPQVEALRANLQRLEHHSDEVVFLAYLPECWKYFEPLWEKEMADPESRVVVMPLPVYDMNPDGSTGKLNYDLGAFPEKIHPVSVEEYDLSAHHPKRIYYQVPYDGYNPSASVHPYFYSNELVTCTDELVYVPWFPISEIVDGDEKGRYTLEQFVKMPGTIHADRILLSGEYMKDIYVDALCELCGSDTRGLWEKRIEIIDELSWRKK